MGFLRICDLLSSELRFLGPWESIASSLALVTRLHRGRPAFHYDAWRSTAGDLVKKSGPIAGAAARQELQRCQASWLVLGRFKRSSRVFLLKKRGWLYLKVNLLGVCSLGGVGSKWSFKKMANSSWTF